MVSWSVCLSVMTVSPAKMAEPIPLGMWTWVGLRNHLLDRGPDPHWKGQLSLGRISPSPLCTVLESYVCKAVNGDRPPSWIYLTHIGTTVEVYLVLFIVLQNLIGTDTVVSVI